MISVDVDASAVHRGMAKLAGDLPTVAQKAALDEAKRVRARIVPNVPRRSGRLVSTVDVVTIPDGAAVSYGGGLPYAAYIERRSHAVARGVVGAADEYHRAAVTAAEQLIGSL